MPDAEKATEDTIFALATAPGRSGIAVVRLSGPRSVDVLTRLGGTVPAPRGTRLCRLIDGSGDLLDEALVVHFAEGASFTGESVVELQLHGSMAVIRAVLDAVEATALARLAEPGEFTRRALLNDRLDLSQVQGLGDLIDAETEAQRRQAMRYFRGEMAEKIKEWRKGLVRAIALLEATIDFADEEVPEDVYPEVLELVTIVRNSIEEELSGSAAAARIRSGYEVALVGAPNVGKSALLNALTRSDAAIVSDIAGTTRDVIEVRVDAGGLLVSILDMAGIREAGDPIEQLGIERARRRAAHADMRIFLHEGPGLADPPVPFSPGDIEVRTKSDLGDWSGVSSVTGEGIEDLLAEIASTLSDRAHGAGLVATDRDRSALGAASVLLADALADIGLVPTEIVSDTIRDASRRIQSIIGGIDTEMILSEIFSSFCVGK